ncbi:MAG TPA: hypothetical protein PKC14_03420 [Candidatus Absconditabacterales bacterium]|nr:hypothetical protein [Candidatus Absconditabacterales bacterium]
MLSGDTIFYTLTYQNIGSHIISGYTLSFILGTGLDLVSVSTPLVSSGLVSSGILFSYTTSGSLAVGQTGVLYLTALALFDLGTGSSYDLWAEISGSQLEINTGNNAIYQLAPWFTAPVCGNFVIEAGEQCDAGPGGSSLCSISCTAIIVIPPVALVSPSGGGGRSNLSLDYCPNGDDSPSYYDKSCISNVSFEPVIDQNIFTLPTVLFQSKYTEPLMLGCKYFDVAYYLNGTFRDMDNSPDKRESEIMRLNCYRKGRYDDWHSYSSRPVTFGEMVKTLTKVSLLYDSTYLPQEGLLYEKPGYFSDLGPASWESHYANDALRIGLISDSDFAQNSDELLNFDGERFVSLIKLLPKMVRAYEYLNGEIILDESLKKSSSLSLARTQPATFEAILKAGIIGMIDPTIDYKWNKPVTRIEFAKMFIKIFDRHLTIKVSPEVVKSELYTTINKQLRFKKEGDRIPFLSDMIDQIKLSDPDTFREKTSASLSEFIYLMQVIRVNPYKKPSYKEVVTRVIQSDLFILAKSLLDRYPTKRNVLLPRIGVLLSGFDKATFFQKYGLTEQEYFRYLGKIFDSLYNR